MARRSRIFHPEGLHSGTLIDLDETAAKHLIQVLRLKPGSPIVLFDGSGRDFAASLHSANKKHAQAEVADMLTEEPPAIIQIELAPGISRGERMDWVIQKAVELGVTQISPLFTERSMVQLKGDRLHTRIGHWQGVIRHACEQSGRSRLPTLNHPQTLSQWLHHPPISGIMLDHRAKHNLVDLAAPETPISLLVGPEGGLSETERTQARTAGLTGVRMGPRVLRTETAPLAALSVIQALWGDFRIS